jgi:hypothetical protein
MYDKLLKLFENTIKYNNNILLYYPISSNNSTFSTSYSNMDDQYYTILLFTSRNYEILKKENKLIEKFFNNDKQNLEIILKKLHGYDNEKKKIFEYIYYDYLNTKNTNDIDFYLLYLHYSNNISLQPYRIDELIKKQIEGGYQQKYSKYKNKLLQLK